MTTLTFKLDEAEARHLRVEAKRANLTLSELIRLRLRSPMTPPQRVGLVTCPLTGTIIFGTAPQFGSLTTATVKELLGEFP